MKKLKISIFIFLLICPLLVNAKEEMIEIDTNNIIIDKNQENDIEEDNNTKNNLQEKEEIQEYLFVSGNTKINNNQDILTFTFDNGLDKNIKKMLIDSEDFSSYQFDGTTIIIENIKDLIIGNHQLKVEFEKGYGKIDFEITNQEVEDKKIVNENEEVKEITEEYYADQNSSQDINILDKIRELLPSTLNFDVKESYVVEEFGKTDDVQKRLLSLIKDKINSIMRENGYGTLDELGYDVKISYWSSFYDAYIEIYSVNESKNMIVLKSFSYLNTNEEKDEEVIKKISERTKEGVVKTIYEAELGIENSDYNPDYLKEKEYIENYYKDLGVTIYYLNHYTSNYELNKNDGFIFYIFLNDKLYMQSHYYESFIPYVTISDDVTDIKNYVKEKVEEYLKSKNIDIENGYIEISNGYNYYTNTYMGKVNVRYNEDKLQEVINALESGISLNKTEYEVLKLESSEINNIIKEEVENVLNEKNISLDNFNFEIVPDLTIYDIRNIDLNFKRDNYNYKTMKLKITYSNSDNYQESIQKEVDEFIKGLSYVYEEYVMLEEELPSDVSHLDEYLDDIVAKSNISGLEYIDHFGFRFSNTLSNTREDIIIFFVDKVFYGNDTLDSCNVKKVIVPHTSVNIVEDGLDIVKKYLLEKGLSYINENTNLRYENGYVYYSEFGNLGKIKIEKENVQKLEAIISEETITLDSLIDDLIVTIKYDYNKFIRVLLNDEVLDENNYTVHEGSTIVTLKPEFIKALSAGEYKLDIVFTDGEAETNFQILETKVLKGDLNFDLKIDIIDVKLLLLETFNTHTEKDYLLMDMNLDSKIDIVDVKLLLLETFNVTKLTNERKATLSMSYNEEKEILDSKPEFIQNEVNTYSKVAEENNIEIDNSTNSSYLLKIDSLEKESYKKNNSNIVLFKKEEDY